MTLEKGQVVRGRQSGDTWMQKKEPTGVRAQKTRETWAQGLRIEQGL